MLWRCREACWDTDNLNGLASSLVKATNSRSWGQECNLRPGPNYVVIILKIVRLCCIIPSYCINNSGRMYESWHVEKKPYRYRPADTSFLKNIFFWGWGFFSYYSIFNTSSSAAPQIPLCQDRCNWCIGSQTIAILYFDFVFNNFFAMNLLYI